MRASIVNSAIDVDDIQYPEITFNGVASWDRFYDSYIAGKEGPVSVQIVVKNKLNYTLPDTEIVAIYVDLSKAGTADVVNDLTLGKTFTLFPYDEEAVARGESDPELAVFSGSEEDSADKYVQTVITASETFSNDVPVLWRINGVAQLIEPSNTNIEQNLSVDVSPDAAVSSDAAISAGSVSVASSLITATEDDFSITFNPENAGTVKTDKVDITASSIAGVTPKGSYGLIVESSEDGENWEQKGVLKMDTSDNGGNSQYYSSSSSSGCDAGVSVSGIVMLLSALIFRRKTR